ncbi:MAG TPA: ABC transporter permease [Terracidiphilus sp.]|nr:ABC transporter permease [Terracidiphilus sp.]
MKRLISRLRNFATGRHGADRFREEIEQHIAMQTEESIRAGLSPEEAHRLARLKFGTVAAVREELHAEEVSPILEKLWLDLRYALRQLRRSPGFTATVLVTLALGIGANIAVYSLVDAVLLRPLQFRNENRLVQVFEERPALGLIKDTPAPANYFDWKRRSHVFSDMAAAKGDIYTITGNGRPEEVDGAPITANLLSLLGVQPLLGRSFTADEDKPGNAVVLISAGIWQQRYGSDPHIVGRTIHLNGVPYRILGVMPFGFTFPDRSALWVPLAFTTAEQLERDSHFLQVYGLLRPGVSLASATQEMSDISLQLEHEYPATNRGLSTSIVTLRAQLLGGSRLAIFVLASGVVILLLITFINVAGLMIARAANRQREVAVRVALGASRLSLLRQGLAESLVLSIGGSILGVAFAWGSMPVIRHFVPETIAAWAHPEMNWTVMLFSVLLCVTAALAFGLFGQSAAAARPQEALSQRSRSSTDARQKLRSVLVTGEIALTTIILTSTGLLSGTFWKIVHTDLGFNPDSVLTMRTELPVSAQTPYREFSARVSFYQRVLDQAERLPGVKSAGYTTFLPFTNPGGSTTVLVQGAPALPIGKVNDVGMRVVTPNYFQALEIPLVLGRTFTEADGGNKTPLVVINQKMAQQYWPNGEAIGRQFRFDDPGTPWMTVIGIVGNVRQANVETPSRAEMYFSYEQNMGIPGYFKPRDLAIRVAGDPNNYTDAVERAIWSVDPGQPVSEVQSMRHLVNTRMETYILEAKLFAFFSCAALLLSALGIYGLMSYNVTHRTQEIGIRMALGAQRQQVLSSFVTAAFRLLLFGLVLGSVGSVAATRLLGSMLYGISGIVWGVGALPILVLAVSVALAAYIPARRAAALDPMQALRSE